MDLPDRSELEALRTLSGPADLVLRVWRLAGVWTPSDRDGAGVPPSALASAFHAAAQQDDGQAAVTGLIDALLNGWPQDLTAYAEQSRAAGALLCFLGAMDEVFSLVHPRTLRLAPGPLPRLRIPNWLRRLEFKCACDGFYAADDAFWLLARGPLQRSARSPIASYADSLADRYSAISVCRRTMAESQRPIEIRMCPVGSDAARGVPHPARPGCETVGFVAVAEAATDLEVSVEERNGREYVDFRPRAGLDVADRIITAARSVGPVDLLVCPELTVGHEDARRLSGLLETAGHRLAGVVLAGSGLSAEMHADDRHWNEARLMNGAGVVLATQRKVWPFGMARSKASRYEILQPDSRATGLVMEDVASGREIAVIDLSGFGRMIILICQDFEAQPLVSDLIQEYQPDWVLVPILDLPLRDYGWTNNRSFNLSGYAQSRFVVVNSLTLFSRAEGAFSHAPAIGLAVGPRDPMTDVDGAEVDRARAFALALPATARSPHHASLTWRDGSAAWRQFVLTTSA